MEEQDRSPQEDISYIRHILEKTADDMKTAAPWFTGLGLVWLIYGVICAVLRIVMVSASLSAAAAVSIVNGALGWLFYIVLAAGFIVWRRRQQSGGLTRKLIDMWGVCVAVFIGLSLCLLMIVPGAAVRLIGIGAEQAGRLSQTCAVGQSVLFFVLPMLPLLITSVFLERRGMAWACAVLAVFAAAVVCAQIILMFQTGFEVGRSWVLGWTAAAALLDILPGVLLLLFGRSLKRG